MSTFATIRSYRELREAGRVFHGKVRKVIPRPIIVSTATELGLWRKGILVASEDGADVLADRMIYDKRWAGKSALEQFEEEVVESAWTDSERRFARAMMTAYMSLFEIVDTSPEATSCSSIVSPERARARRVRGLSWSTSASPRRRFRARPSPSASWMLEGSS
jgi:hypothetical protein